MKITLRPLRWPQIALLAAPLVLGGCQGESESPTALHSTDAVAPAPSRAVSVASSDHSTTDQPVAIAAPELASTRDRATVDAASAEIQHDVQQTSNVVTQGANDLKSGVAQAVGEAQTQAKQAANGALDGAKGFAAELRDEAAQSVSGAVNEVKSGVTDSINQAKSNAKNQIQGAVDGAKANARRRAKAVGDSVQKSAEGVKDQVVNSLLGPAPKK